MGNSASFNNRIDKQEQYVDRNFEKVKNQLNKDYTSLQIKAKLRQEYHRNSNNNDYIMAHVWNSVRL